MRGKKKRHSETLEEIFMKSSDGKRFPTISASPLYPISLFSLHNLTSQTLHVERLWVRFTEANHFLPVSNITYKDDSKTIQTKTIYNTYLSSRDISKICPLIIPSTTIQHYKFFYK